MNSRKIKEIVKFYIQKNIQNEWFVLLNIIILIAMIIFTNSGHIKELLESYNINLFNKEFKIAILDNDNLAVEEIKNAFKEQENIEIEVVTENNYTKENIPDDFALVEVSSDETNLISIKIISKEGIDGSICDDIIDAIKNVRADLFAEKLGITRDEVDILESDVSVEKIFLGVDADNSDQKEIIKNCSTFIVYTISFILFAKIASEIAQEKVSKSIEYVLTSVTAEEYLLAKIISVMLIILIQVLYTIVYFFIGNLICNLIYMFQGYKITTSTALGAVALLDKDIAEYIVLVFVYSFLNLILMSIIQAALSSKTKSMAEAGNSIMFIMAITIAGFFMSNILITTYTNMTLGLYILSCIPLLSNYFVPAIVIIGQATPLQIFVSFALLIISIPIVFKYCAKVLKNGVLDYSNKKVKRNERTFEIEQKILASKAKFKRYSFAIGMAVLVYIVIQIILELLLNLLVAPLIADLGETKIKLIFALICSALSLISAYGVLRTYTQETTTEKKKISTKSKLVIIIFGISFIFLIQFFMSLIYPALGIDYNAIDTLSIEDDFTLPTVILYFIEVAIVPAIFEELFFRKALIDISEKFGKVFAVIMSALIFGLAHMNLGQFIFAFCLGIMFGIIYIKTKDIKLTMILHFINNGYAAVTEILYTANLLNENVFAIIETVLLIIYAIIVVGIISTYINKNKANIKLQLKYLKESSNSIGEYKYILCDYTFLISLVLIICFFAVSENMLRSF
jgi:membrane protease YdiL (CAAX protease family)